MEIILVWIRISNECKCRRVQNPGFNNHSEQSRDGQWSSLCTVCSIYNRIKLSFQRDPAMYYSIFYMANFHTVRANIALHCISLEAYIAQNARWKKGFVSDDIEAILPYTAHWSSRCNIPSIYNRIKPSFQRDPAKYNNIFNIAKVHTLRAYIVLHWIASLHCTECTFKA